MDNEEDPLCLTITAYKRADVDFDDYVKYMHNIHAAIVSQHMARHGIIEYTQVGKSSCSRATSIS